MVNVVLHTDQLDKVESGTISGKSSRCTWNPSRRMSTWKLVYIGLSFELRSAYPLKTTAHPFHPFQTCIILSITFIADSICDCGVCLAGRETSGPILPPADIYQYTSMKRVSCTRGRFIDIYMVPCSETAVFEFVPKM